MENPQQAAQLPTINEQVSYRQIVAPDAASIDDSLCEELEYVDDLHEERLRLTK
jgi:hypothetical protein